MKTGARVRSTTKETIAPLEKQLAELDAMPAMLRFLREQLESDYMRDTLARGEEAASEPNSQMRCG